MHAFRYIILGVLLTGLLSSCGLGGRPSSSASVIGVSTNASLPSHLSREEILSQFTLLNSRGETTAPVTPLEGRAPFGVLLNLPENGERKQCTITEVAYKLAWTGAHCVLNAGKKSPVSDLFVTFFSNRSGRQVTFPVEEVLFVGSENEEDVALVQMGDEAANQWDVATSDFLSNVRRYQPSEFNEKAPVVEAVSLWAFSPVNSRPDLAERTGVKLGAAFEKLDCSSSRAEPWLSHVVDGKRTDIKKYKSENKKLNRRTHVFLDSCAAVSGDSGAIFTSPDFDSLNGIFHWILTKDRFDRNEEFFGNQLTWMNVWSLVPGDGSASVLEVGTSFQSLLGKYPKLTSKFTLSASPDYSASKPNP